MKISKLKRHHDSTAVSRRSPQRKHTRRHKKREGVWVVILMFQGTSSEIYNTLEGDDYTHNSEDEGTMSVIREDVETV